MTNTRETVKVHTHPVCCDGASGIRAVAGATPAALGHPRVWLEIDERGFVDCPYCETHYVLENTGH